MKNTSKKLVVIGLSIFILSCTSVAEKVEKNKAKFIQAAKEHTKKLEFTDINNIDVNASLENARRYLNYLDVESIQTIYEDKIDSLIKLDSLVVFEKSGYKIFYDYKKIARSIEMIKNNSLLKDIEQIDERLYIGKK